MAQYIDKAAVVAEIKERIDRDNERAASYSSNSEHDYFCRVKEKVYKSLLSFLDTLEVKDVDFIKEFYTFSEKHKLMDKDIEFTDVEKAASFFFQLGLKATQKGE